MIMRTGFSRALTALLAAVLCLTPTLAPARAPDPAQAAINDIARGTAPYQKLILDSTALLNLTMQGAGEAFAASGPEKPAWLDGWKAQVAAARQTVADERAAIKPFQSPTMDTYAKAPEVARLRSAMKTFPGKVTALADQVLATVDETIPLVDAAVGGDMQSKARLQLSVLKGLNESMDAQDSLLDLTAAVTVESHPDVTLAQAVKAMHAARRRLQQFRIDQLSGLNPDPQAALADARASLAQSRAAAARAPALAAAMVKKVQATAMSPALKAKIIDAFGTYQASTDVELQIDDLVERNMHIYVEDFTAPGVAEAFDRDMMALSQKRVELQALRREKLL